MTFIITVIQCSFIAMNSVSLSGTSGKRSNAATCHLNVYLTKKYQGNGNITKFNAYTVCDERPCNVLLSVCDVRPCNGLLTVCDVRPCNGLLTVCDVRPCNGLLTVCDVSLVMVY
jgi:hypothetical protein